MPALRLDGRSSHEPRPLHIRRHWIPSLPGSVLLDAGLTRVLCTAVVEEGVPLFLKNTDEGWLTAEYCMLPASTGQRRQRERGPRIDGRSVEIQRLIGRCLRSVLNRKALKGRTVWVDCDVLAADGGTRTACINAAWVAVHDALRDLEPRGDLRFWPLTDSIQAISVGLVEDEPMVDLSYYEDSSAQVDLNLVMTGKGRMVEFGGGAEQGTFSVDQMNTLLSMGQSALGRVRELQEQAIRS